MSISSLLSTLRYCTRGILISIGSLFTSAAYASVYSGGGLTPEPIGGGISAEPDIIQLIVRTLLKLFDYILLIGVIAIIIAGIYLITSNGDEGQKDKAKSIVIYVIIGIILILLSRVIVMFVNTLI